MPGARRLVETDAVPEAAVLGVPPVGGDRGVRERRAPELVHGARDGATLLEDGVDAVPVVRADRHEVGVRVDVRVVPPLGEVGAAVELDAVVARVDVEGVGAVGAGLGEGHALPEGVPELGDLLLRRHLDEPERTAGVAHGAGDLLGLLELGVRHHRGTALDHGHVVTRLDVGLVVEVLLDVPGGGEPEPVGAGVEATDAVVPVLVGRGRCRPVPELEVLVVLVDRDVGELQRVPPGPVSVPETCGSAAKVMNALSLKSSVTISGKAPARSGLSS